MSTPGQVPMPPGGPQGSPGGAPPTPSPIGGNMGSLAKVSQAAEKAAEDMPESAQAMRQVQDIVRQTMMKAIQHRQPQGQTPQI